MNQSATTQKWFSVAFTVLVALFLAIAPVSAQTNNTTDVLSPSDVGNVKATAGNGQVTLSWDLSSDNVAVAGYNIYYGTQPVTNDSGEYSDWVDAGNVASSTVKNLTNGTKYYFALTAYDAAGNLSENYSDEVSATPTASAKAVDDEAPQVTKTESVYQTVVKVVFSEEVVLPKNSPELAFNITNSKTLDPLEVVEAMPASDYKGTLYPEDSTMTKEEQEAEMKNTVVLITEAQKIGDEYTLEVSIEVEDKAGNPIASGNTDTGLFTGSATAEPKIEDTTADAEGTDAVDEEAPSIVSAKSISSVEVEVTFSEKVVLNTDPSTNFLIISEDNADKELKVVGVVLDKTGAKATLTTAEQDAIAYSLVALEVKDVAGNEIAIEKSASSFTGTKSKSLVDSLAPANVTKFLAQTLDKAIVKLTWVPSQDPDLAEQILYKSKDGGKTYDKIVSLGKEISSYEVKDLVPGMEYWLKLTSKDASGNESEGMIAKIKLPETGLGTSGLLAASALLPSMWKKKKKNKK